MGEPPTVTSRRSGSSTTESTVSVAGESEAEAWVESLTGGIAAALPPASLAAPVPMPPTPEAVRTASERFNATRIRANSSSIANGLVR